MAVKRLLAVVVAVALIAGALVIRRFIDDGGELSIGGVASTIYCDSALADACEAAFGDADLRIEPPGVTLERFLGDTDDGAVVWIASNLWFDILSSEQERLGVRGEVTSTSDALVHTPLVLLGSGCEPATWSCVGDVGPSVDVGLDSLDTSAGLAAYAQLVAVELGTQRYATNDFDSAFTDWRRNLGTRTTFSPAQQPVLNIFLTRPGTYDVVATTAAEVEQLGRGELATVPSDAGPDLEVAAVAINGARLPGSLGDLTNELVELGWTEGSAADAERPSGGAMQALRS